MFFSSFLDEAHWKSSERKSTEKFFLRILSCDFTLIHLSVFLFLSLFNLLLITFICFLSHLSLSWLSNSNRPGFLLCSYALSLTGISAFARRKAIAVNSRFFRLSYVFLCEKLFALNQSRHYFSLSSLLSHIRKTQKTIFEIFTRKIYRPFFSCICSNCKKRK